MPGDLVLDSFAGSGTTGHAVLQINKIDVGWDRRFILMELDPNIALNIGAERLRRVIQGYTWNDQKGNEHQEAGLGSGFRFCELGETLFDASGRIRPQVSFTDLAQHVFYSETNRPLPQSARPETPLLGVVDDLAVYLLYNGVLKDKSPSGGNVLAHSVWLRSRRTLVLKWSMGQVAGLALSVYASWRFFSAKFLTKYGSAKMLQLKEYQQRSLDALSAYFQACNQFSDANTAYSHYHRIGQGLVSV